MVFTPEKLQGPLPLRYVSWHHIIMFSISGSMLENLLYVMSLQKQEIDVSLVLKDSDSESENLSSLIHFSVSDNLFSGFAIPKDHTSLI